MAAEKLTMEKAKYYQEGFHIGEFKLNEDLNSILKAISDIHKSNLKSGYSLVGKYKNSKDLKPEVYKYDKAFVDILFSNDIPKLLNDVVGRELYLAHVQLRISYPGSSYMIWHRDTHFYGGITTGNMPPAHKIIFYPTVEGVRHEKIRLIPGSHRKVFENRLLDYLQVFLSKRKTILSSDREFMLFNTELFHHVVPEKNSKGSFRLIYSFVEKEQLENYSGGEELINLYKEKINKKF